MRLEERTLQKDGCSIHYWITPNHNGPWLIFLHGAGADHKMFDDQLKVLDHTYGGLLWDARGHGLSKPIGTDFSVKLLVDDILAIMAKEKMGKATFIGQSMGGNTAQEMAFYHPEKVENMVLIDCTCNTMKLTAAEKMAVWLTPFLISIYPWKMLVNSSVRASSIKPNVQAYLRDSFYSVGPKDFTKIFLETAACLHFEEDYRINKTILLVCGELDKTGNIKKIVSEWEKLESKCEFHWIKDASHCSNQDNPEAFNELLIDFLSRHCPVSAGDLEKEEGNE